MATDLPETKKEEDVKIEADTTEKDWFGKVVQGVREQEKKEKRQIDEQTTTNLATHAFLERYPEESFT